MRAYRNIVIEANCNLSCSYCCKHEVKIDLAETLRNLERVFNRFNPKESCFRVECGGEITLYPDIIAYLEEKALQGYVIEVLSNGIKALDVLKCDTPLRCVFSLDGHTVDMNRNRNLNAIQIENILSAVFQFDADICCVLSHQTIDQVNAFISFLQDHRYKGSLHIFPVRSIRKPLQRYLDYDLLVKTDFIPSAEYFKRWEHIYKYHKRNFICDMIKNGYVYNIHPNGITMVKCDCGYKWSVYEHNFGDEKIFNTIECGTCISDLEFNNNRDMVSG